MIAIGTKSAQTRARSHGIVEHEGGGWYPTLEWVGEARPAIAAVAAKDID